MRDVLLLVIATLALLGLEAAVIAVRWQDQRRRDAARQVFRLHFPTGLDSDSVVAFVRSLTALRAGRGPLEGRSSVVFEVRATEHSVKHRLRLPRHRADFILGQLRAAVPAIGVEEVEANGEEPTSAGQWRLVGGERPLRTDEPDSAAAAFLSALRPLERHEAVTVQWVTIAVPAAPAVGNPTTSPTTPAWPWWLAAVWSRRPTESISSKDSRDNASEPPFAVALRIGARATTTARSAALVRQAAAMLRVVERPGVRFVRRVRPVAGIVRALADARTPLVEFGGHLNARELATVLAWPVGSPRVRGLVLGASRRLEADPAVPSTGRVLGVSDLAGSDRPVALSAVDSLHHAHVIGPTGVGKSTLLGNLITQDIQAGRSVVVLDPKGDLVTEVIDRIPAARQDDVVLLDPTDETRPVGLNLLHGSDQAPELVTDAVVAIFHRLYAAYWGPRTSDLVTSALLTLARAPGMTLCELPLLFTHEGFRRRLTGSLDDPVLAGFWAWFEAMGPGERAAALGPVMNKLRAFLLRRRLRNVIGQTEPTWSLTDVLNRRQVLLVNLARGQLGSEAASLLGSMVVALLWQAIQVRTIRLPALVVIDEFQDVINLPTDLGEVLAQARGFGVGLTLAHQHLGQLSPGLRQAVLANARTKVVFQTAADDATVLARQLGGELNPTDLTSLAAHHAYVAACAGGEVRSPASIRTSSLPPGLGTAAVVRSASREHFGRDRSDIEAAIAGRHLITGPGPDDLGRRRRAS